MNDDVQIIPIDPQELNRDITALVQFKKDILPEMVGYSLEQVKNVYRGLYRQAFLAKRPLMIARLLCQRSPNVDEAGHHVWRTQTADGRTVAAVYDSHSGKLIVRVGNQKVLSNEHHQDEMLIPGNWMFLMRDAYYAGLEESRWKQETADEKQRADLISDFINEV